MEFSVFDAFRESAWMKGALYALLGTIVLPVAFYAAGMVVLPFLEKSKTNCGRRDGSSSFAGCGQWQEWLGGA